MLRYAFSDDAVRDLEGISDYLSERNAEASARVLSYIVAAVKRACLYPDAAPELDEPGAVPGTRKLVETHYRYVIYYRVSGRTLVVIRVVYGSKRR